LGAASITQHIGIMNIKNVCQKHAISLRDFNYGIVEQPWAWVDWGFNLIWQGCVPNKKREKSVGNI